MQTSVPQPVFLNLEFIFSWLWGNISSIFSLRFFGFLQFFASLLVIIGITIVLYCLVRLYELKQEDVKKGDQAKQVAATLAATSGAGVATGIDLPGAVVRNETWEHIRTKLLSDNASDWRLAIIEADIYMDRLLDAKGYRGDTIGDKLKNLSNEQFGSLQIAWEAHKVRNRIAHEGSAFVITMPEARRVLSYFEIVFRDLGAIE